MIPSKISYDLFISHAWRFHDTWTKMVELLDAQDRISWRNFSVPWYDPAMDPNTPEGARHVHQNLEQQVKPANVMLLLIDVYSVKSARKWVDMEIGFANRHGVPIITVGNLDDIPAEAVEVAKFGDANVAWDSDSIVAKIAEVTKKTSEGRA